jgi:hypothetical protein
MPGFVDVSGMTSEQVRRMGHADDDYETPRQTWRPKAKPQGVKHSVDNVWGAACAAQRINGSYVKETQHRFDENLNTTVVERLRNRDIMTDLLANPALLTVEDIAQGQECRKFLQQDITLRGLKSRLTEFDTAVSKTVAVSEEFDSVTHKYELAVVASLPASHQRSLARQDVDSRVRQSAGGYVGAVDAKIQMDVEVVSANYSHTYNIFWVTAITADNQAVFFSYKSKLVTGSWITIRGTVKAHRDSKTQLNRVRIV